MKRFDFRTTTLAVLFCAAVLPACKKYLSTEPLSTIDPSVAFSNLPNAKAALNGAYLSLAGDYGYGIRASYYYAYDDDAIMGGGSSLSSARHEEAHYTLGAGNTDIVNTFNQFYKGIEAANNCIYYIPRMPQFASGTGADQNELRRMLGEALTIRAQYFFELVRIWGDVPEPRVPSSFVNDLFLKRTNRDSIYKHILSDLAEAKTLMPWLNQVSRDERFTKGTAMALRAKVALFAGGYSLRGTDAVGQMQRPANYLDDYKIARDECAELMQNRGVHNLYPTFKGLWKDVVDAHKAVDPQGELIMQVAMANGTNSDSKIGAQNGTKINGVGGSLGNVLPTYFYQFDSTDIRRDVTVVPFEVVRDVYGRGHASNSIYDGKFRRDWITSPSYYMSNGQTSGSNPVTLTPASNSSIQNFQLNWPLIRFSDVLLMFAEAENEINNGPTADAIAAWKEVSLRGHNGDASLVPAAPGDKNGFFKLLVRERHLEFGGEGIRKFDLIRWNLLSTALTETKANLQKFAAGTAMAAPSYMAAPPDYTLTANLPKQMWFYQNMPAENNVPTQAGSQIWVYSFYMPTPSSTPKDPTNGNNSISSSSNRINWFASTNITTTYVNYYAYGFVSGKSELYPIPQASIDANANLRPQNPGY
ncbi:RagB/SusD family nutrient uptake outer membrane protein [Flavisolibacter nicotianae]|uniref:RagB/SusD family nutrient uptake outer membrane protein n=1 Tax=Flavisolibacter nicotianae TaxID=2364882 RepID=UPI000EB2C466|nr:RagB/SusD family nutrient uptake outer membrane protein [Flavisolibacter nicotianae]